MKSQLKSERMPYRRRGSRLLLGPSEDSEGVVVTETRVEVSETTHRQTSRGCM